ncbi:MAG: MBL fold metallo-hydrolase [Myxococcales bacterium]|nr:MBL fold metallo-hydrolase [Myxococcales bacterium]
MPLLSSHRRIIALTYTLLICLSPSLSAAASGPKRTGQSVVIHQGRDARVGTFVSNAWGFNTSSYWLEGPTGLILIDTQFLPSAGLRAVEVAERQTGKKVKLAIVLHPNPDKFNGTLALQKRGIRVITSAQVLAHIPAVHKLRKSWFYERYAPDYPAKAPAPESFGSKTRTLRAAGLTLKLHVLGKGCSAAHVVVGFDRHLFVGDLVANGHHAWLELGHMAQWRKRLMTLKAMKPKWVHPGRGPTAGAALLDGQMAYLDWVAKRVQTEKPTGALPDATLERLIQAVTKRFPARDYPIFLRLGLPAVWRTASVRNARGD